MASNRFLLITSDLETRPIHLDAVDEGDLFYTLPNAERRLSVPLDRCIAIVRERPSTSSLTNLGMLRFADGRQYPGMAARPATPAPPTRTRSQPRERFNWHPGGQSRFFTIGLDEIDWIIFKPGAVVPPLVPGGLDRVALSNGDLLEGFVAAIREALVLEVDEGDNSRSIEIPVGRVAAVNLVTAARSDASRRAWLTDGTIMKVERIAYDESGKVLLMVGVPRSGPVPGSPPWGAGARVDTEEIVAVLLSPQRIVPLASLDVYALHGPQTRYTTPEPRVLDSEAPLGLSPIELRGPVRVEYELPPGVDRFAAEAVLPESSRHFGDFEFIVREGEREVYRARLNAASPTANVNVPLTGRSLAIELLPGRHGAIQNHVVLRRAMLRLE